MIRAGIPFSLPLGYGDKDVPTSWTDCLQRVGVSLGLRVSGVSGSCRPLSGLASNNLGGRSPHRAPNIERELRVFVSSTVAPRDHR